MYNLLETALINSNFLCDKFEDFFDVKRKRFRAQLFMDTTSSFFTEISASFAIWSLLLCAIGFMTLYIFLFCSDKCQLCVFLKGLLTRFYRLFQYLD